VGALERMPTRARSHVTAPELSWCKQVSDGLGQQADVECARLQACAQAQLRLNTGSASMMQAHLILSVGLERIGMNSKSSL
jgi:hypothetical protein